MLKKFIGKATFLIFIYAVPNGLSAQILDNSLFRIYRAEFVLGTVTQLRLNSDKTFEFKVLQFNCSLCDHDSLRKTINNNGNWVQEKDTIYLEKGRKLLVLGDSVLKPLFVIGMDIKADSDTRLVNHEKKIREHKMNRFHLVYDTYPSGVAKLIADKYRMRNEEYIIELEPSGSVKFLKYFSNGKRKRKIK